MMEHQIISVLNPFDLCGHQVCIANQFHVNMGNASRSIIYSSSILLGFRLLNLYQNARNSASAGNLNTPPKRALFRVGIAYQALPRTGDNIFTRKAQLCLEPTSQLLVPGM